MMSGLRESHMNIPKLTFLYCFLELLMSGLAFGLINITLGTIKRMSIPLDNILMYFGSGLFTSFFRIIVFQAAIQFFLVFLAISFGGWQKLWPVLLAVIVSMILWSLIAWGLAPNKNPNSFSIAFGMGGPSILIGSISTWLILYKWLGLKP